MTTSAPRWFCPRVGGEGYIEVVAAVDFDSEIASLREQLSCAQSEAKFAREHLERERALRTPAQEAGDVVNHDEALQLAYLKRKESNLARCYIELRERSSPAASHVTVGEAKPLRQQHPMWDLLHKYGNACESLGCSTDRTGRDLAVVSVNEAWEAVWRHLERLQQPAEPVSKSVAKRIAAQKGEPYPFTAEPVCGTEHAPLMTPLRMHSLIGGTSYIIDANSAWVCTGPTAMLERILEAIALAAAANCSPAAPGLTREEVEALTQGEYRIRQAARETITDQRSKELLAMATTLRNLAARK
jgi:hypothetical protein